MTKLSSINQILWAIFDYLMGLIVCEEPGYIIINEELKTLFTCETFMGRFLLFAL